MNKVKLLQAFSVAVVLVSFIMGFYVFPLLPAVVPVHWDAAGNVNGTGPAWMGAFLLPAILAIIVGFFFLIPRIEVYKENLRRFEKSYWLFVSGFSVIFLAIFLLTLAPNFGYAPDMSVAIMGLVSVLLIFTGMLLPSFRRNYFLGVRTPWALADERVWDKTHVFAGKAFIFAGLILFVSSLFPKFMFWGIIALVLVLALGTFGYSYWVYSKLPKSAAKAAPTVPVAKSAAKIASKRKHVKTPATKRKKRRN